MSFNRENVIWESKDETVRLMTAAALALVTVSATVTVDSDEYEDLI